MTLKLVMIRCPDNVAPERREVRGGEFSIGRGKDNQWVVADPDRHLSKKHCQFTYGVGEWEVQDHSTNGTFLNQSGDPIGKGASQKLRHGDRVKFGLYEIEVIIDEEEQARERDNFLAYERGGGTAVACGAVRRPGGREGRGAGRIPGGVDTGRGGARSRRGGGPAAAPLPTR